MVLAQPTPGLVAGAAANTAVYVLGIKVLLAGLTWEGVLSSWVLGTLSYAAFGAGGYSLVCLYFIVGSLVGRATGGRAVRPPTLPPASRASQRWRPIWAPPRPPAGHQGQAGAKRAGGHSRSAVGAALAGALRARRVGHGRVPCASVQHVSTLVAVQGSVLGSGLAGMICAVLALCTHDVAVWRVRSGRGGSSLAMRCGTHLPPTISARPTLRSWRLWQALQASLQTRRPAKLARRLGSARSW